VNPISWTSRIKEHQAAQAAAMHITKVEAVSCCIFPSPAAEFSEDCTKLAMQLLLF
jgi:hypothetical protein